MGARVALVASSYHPYPGGVEQHTRQVARLLHERGRPVEVWTVDRGEHLGVQELDGVTVRYLPTPLPAMSPRGLAGFAVRAVPALAAWRAAYRAFRPDVLHVQCFGPNGVYADALASLTRTPLVLSNHGETFMDAHGVFDTSRILRRGLRHALTTARVSTAVSGLVVEDLQRRFGAGDLRIVANGVPAETIADEVPTRGPGEPVVFCVGRLERNKGFDLAVRAFAQLTRPARLVVVGTGTAQTELAALVRELGLEGRVSFPGQLSPEQVREGMSRAAVVVMPSRQEAFGIVALEAWAAGVPLVATSLGGPRDFVRDGVDGLLADPTNVPALTAATERLLTEAGLADQLALAGLRRVREFTWDTVVDDYEMVYRALLDTPAAA